MLLEHKEDVAVVVVAVGVEAPTRRTQLWWWWLANGRGWTEIENIGESLKMSEVICVF